MANEHGPFNSEREALATRAAAEALNRGDFAACYLDEAGNPVAGEREEDEHGR